MARPSVSAAKSTPALSKKDRKERSGGCKARDQSKSSKKSSSSNKGVSGRKKKEREVTLTSGKKRTIEKGGNDSDSTGDNKFTRSGTFVLNDTESKALDRTNSARVRGTRANGDIKRTQQRSSSSPKEITTGDCDLDITSLPARLQRAYTNLHTKMAEMNATQELMKAKIEELEIIKANGKRDRGTSL